MKSHIYTPFFPCDTDKPSSVKAVVAELHADGFTDQLAWLEAYLRDEASDRSMDGKMM